MKKVFLLIIAFQIFISCCKMDKATIVDLIRTPSHYEPRSKSVTYKDAKGNQKTRTEYHQQYVSETFEVKYMGYCYDPDEPANGKNRVRTQYISEEFFYSHKKGDTLIFNKQSNDW